MILWLPLHPKKTLLAERTKEGALKLSINAHLEFQTTNYNQRNYPCRSIYIPFNGRSRSSACLYSWRVWIALLGQRLCGTNRLKATTRRI
jgi:hypothetical protein